MSQGQMETFLIVNAEKFRSEHLIWVKRNFESVEDGEFTSVFVNLKSPGIALILSILFGSLGIDRFYIGSVGVGFAKMIASFFLSFSWVIFFFISFGVEDANESKDLRIETFFFLIFLCFLNFVWQISEWFRIIGLTKDANFKKIALNPFFFKGDKQ